MRWPLLFLLAFFAAALPVAAQIRTDLGIPIDRKVLVIDFDPILEDQGNLRLTKYKNWADPITLENEYSQNISIASGGLVTYQVVERQIIDDFPQKLDGFDYSDTTY